MARPRSESKRQTILQAATRLFAEEGLNAPTARIARHAGVAEGTIFTYFANKDELMNQLYLELKAQLRAALVPSPESAGLKEQVQLAWKSYIDWGVAHPAEHEVLAKLGLSTAITEATRAAANQAFCDVSHLLERTMRQGVLRGQAPNYVGALMAAMANTTMDFMIKHPDVARSLCEDGFSAFWKSIATE